MAIVFNGVTNPDRIRYKNPRDINAHTVNRIVYNGEIVWPRKIIVNYSLQNYWYPEGGSSTEGKEYAYRSMIGVGYNESIQYMWIQKDTSGPEPLTGTQELIGNYLFFRGTCWTDSTMVDPSARVRVLVTVNGDTIGNHGTGSTIYTYSYKIPDNITTINVTTSCGDTGIPAGTTPRYHTVFIDVVTVS